MPKPDTLAHRLQLLLSSTRHGADVHFLVGGKRAKKEVLSAHKSILSSASDVFEAMFQFDAENATTVTEGKAVDGISTVEITDVGPSAFKAMLRYIYHTGDLSGLNGENAVAVLYAAKKYNIVGLHNACLAFPIPELQNVFIAFAQARFIGEKDFARRCLAYIDANVGTLVQSEAFLQIDYHLLYEILERDQLKIGGVSAVWNAAFRWADEQCRQNGYQCSAKNRCIALGPALFRIHFPHIPRVELSTPGGGQIMLKIKHFSEFARDGGRRHSDADALHLAGCRWKIVALSHAKSGTLGFFLKCDPIANTDAKWSVNCTATMRIVSRWKYEQDFTRKFDAHIFDVASNSWGYPEFQTFEYLMDSYNGLYYRDTVTLSIAVTADEPRGMK